MEEGHKRIAHHVFLIGWAYFSILLYSLTLLHKIIYITYFVLLLSAALTVVISVKLFKSIFPNLNRNCPNDLYIFLVLDIEVPSDSLILYFAKSSFLIAVYDLQPYKPFI